MATTNDNDNDNQNAETNQVSYDTQYGKVTFDVCDFIEETQQGKKTMDDFDI